MRRSELLEASRLNVVARSEPRSAVVEAAESERRQHPKQVSLLNRQWPGRCCGCLIERRVALFFTIEAKCSYSSNRLADLLEFALM